MLEIKISCELIYRLGLECYFQVFLRDGKMYGNINTRTKRVKTIHNNSKNDSLVVHFSTITFSFSRFKSSTESSIPLFSSASIKRL